jgi:hypothetical protein
MRLRYLKLLLFAVILFIPSKSIYAQSKEKAVKEKADPTLDFIYLKNSDESKSLICNLGVSINREVLPIKRSVIKFYAGENAETELGAAITNKDGKAVCTIPKNFKLPVNKEGKYFFKAVYDGNDTLNASEGEVQVKDLVIELNFNDKDSIKTIAITAYEPISDGKNQPLSNEVVKVYVPRMFSMLTIAEPKLDSFGTATVEFPSDIPGDSAGNVKIIVKLEEHSDYGNVEKYEVKKWGQLATKSYLLVHRALWTAVAPLWMIITLTIMLVGVWAHYLYVILRLYMISKAGKEPKNYRE